MGVGGVDGGAESKEGLGTAVANYIVGFFEGGVGARGWLERRTEASII